MLGDELTQPTVGGTRIDIDRTSTLTPPVTVELLGQDGQQFALEVGEGADRSIGRLDRCEALREDESRMLEERVDHAEGGLEIVVMAGEGVHIAELLGGIDIARDGEDHHHAISDESLTADRSHEIIPIKGDVLGLDAGEVVVEALLLFGREDEDEIADALREYVIEPQIAATKGEEEAFEGFVGGTAVLAVREAVL